MLPVLYESLCNQANQVFKGFSNNVPEVGKMSELYQKYKYVGETLYPYRVKILLQFIEKIRMLVNSTLCQIV